MSMRHVEIQEFLSVIVLGMLVAFIAPINSTLSISLDGDREVLMEKQVSRTTEATHKVKNNACLTGNATRLYGLGRFRESEKSDANRSVLIARSANGCDINVVTVCCWIF
jgi:hypothetical protein